MPWYPVEVYEEHYLRSDDPLGQSGFGGDEDRWEAARRPIVEAIDCDGTFLDAGCANGYLMECVRRWSPHRVEPYGLDFSPRLVALARSRLPRWADRIFLGDALEWESPRRFDFVRTELVYAPEDRQCELVERLLGFSRRLIVCGYGSGRSGVPAKPVGPILREWGFEPIFELSRDDPEGGGPLLQLAVLGT
jgi:SAM-dependent methyltransferase